MSTARWRQCSTRVVRAAEFGLGGSVIWLVEWVVGFESAVFENDIDIRGRRDCCSFSGLPGSYDWLEGSSG